MKNLISKVTLLLLCSVFAFSSCSNDDAVAKKTVTVKYRILVNADLSYIAGLDDGGITKLYLYTNKEMAVVSKAHDKEAWTITEEAETEEAAIAACDKKAIAVFDEKLADINAATASIKTKFDAKKAELSAEIALDPTTAHVIYKDYGGILFKGKVEDTYPGVVVKTGALVDLQATGGKK
ncbi:MAG: hypothetical protein RR413_11335 [Christensenellaceae bacterium]